MLGFVSFNSLFCGIGFLEVVGRETRSLGDSRQHTRTNFVTLMKREHEVRPPRTR